MTTRGKFLRALAGALAPAVAWADAARAALRGKLRTGEPASIETASGPVELTGDAPTLLVLADERLKGADFEVVGEPAAKFRIDGIHKRNMFVHKDGRRLMISYWCGVCSIRTWAPGKCMCCQDDTELALAERFETVK